MQFLPITHKGETIFTLVDDADFERFRQFKWWLSAARYVHGRYTGTWKDNYVYLHKLILKAPAGLVIDHKNGIKLDNRRSNLRICTQAQNCINSSVRSNSQSGYKGVARCGKNTWSAQIAYDGKPVWLGTYPNIEGAARAYDKAALELYGDFARTNFEYD